jgi:hypothetical protein
VEINAALAAELAVLTQALDDSRTDVAESLLRLTAGARVAVASYLGLRVTIAHTDPPVVFTVFEDAVEDGDIRTSLMLVLETLGDGCTPRVSLLLFAAVPGAFVDLAADLCWMTGRPLTDVILDEHLDVFAERHAVDALQAASVINQALGVLVGRGYTPEQADQELDARATDAGTNRRQAAALVLSTISAVADDPDVDLA